MIKNKKEFHIETLFFEFKKKFFAQKKRTEVLLNYFASDFSALSFVRAIERSAFLLLALFL